ncbi:MAG: GAF domain-containing protein [Granulosicoccus sp.]|nr:GAF domain-containing protein [Granulosicoccus sp.]
MRKVSQALCVCERREEILNALAKGLEQYLGLAHHKLWTLDTHRQCLSLLASHGYPDSSLNVEMPVGLGPVGIAAMAGLPVRIDHILQSTCESDYHANALEHANAVMGQTRETMSCQTSTRPCCQLALPLLVQGRVIGVLFIEGQHPRHINADEEDALVPIAAQLASSLAMMRAYLVENSADEPCSSASAHGKSIDIRYHDNDSSVFLDETYLIRGVSGALFWKIARIHALCGRSEFTTRELHRCAAELRLPAVHDNLYARLLLLQRRLVERAAPVQIERTGRGRFRILVNGTLRLNHADF